ncbi:MAG: hypothetical protein IMZ65_00645 [Planctomycetes bacterium]|nr:hypothetical protein [Planctomycetota bacterium]
MTVDEAHRIHARLDVISAQLTTIAAVCPLCREQIVKHESLLGGENGAMSRIRAIETTLGIGSDWRRLAAKLLGNATIATIAAVLTVLLSR